MDPATFQKTYKELPNSQRHCLGWWTRLFLGPGARLFASQDHLLNIAQPMFQESWQRLHYENILGIVVTRSGKYVQYNIFWAVLVVFCISFGYYFFDTSQSFSSGEFFSNLAIFIWCLIIFPVFYLCTNLIKGPTCTVSVVTAVQPYEIEALRRKKIADQVIPDLERIIRAYQQPATPQSPPPTPTSTPAEESPIQSEQASMTTAPETGD